MGCQRQHIGANLVGNIAIGCHPVCAKHHFLHIPPLEEVPGSPVRNNFKGDAVLAEFPGSQAGTLQARAGFIHQHMHPLSLLKCQADCPQRRAPIHHCQRPRVAVMNDGIAIFNQGSTILRHLMIDGDILLRHTDGFRFQSMTELVSCQTGSLQHRQHTAQRPLEIYRRGTGFPEGICCYLQVAAQGIRGIR